MFSRLDPLVSFRCPRCRSSLRFRRVIEVPESPGSPHFLCACPACKGEIVLHQHPAFPDNWRWSRFLLPGVACAAIGIFVPSAAGLLPWAVALLVAGAVALVAYMIWQRWGWSCYGLPPGDAPSSSSPQAAASLRNR